MDYGLRPMAIGAVIGNSTACRASPVNGSDNVLQVLAGAEHSTRRLDGPFSSPNKRDETVPARRKLSGNDKSKDDDKPPPPRPPPKPEEPPPLPGVS